MNRFLLAIICLLPALSNASGPLFVEGANGNTPVRYQNPNIILNFDLDMLAVTPTNASTDTLVLNAIGLWNNLATSAVNMTQGADLPFEVNSTNYSTLIPADTNAGIPADDGINPVIYDADGQIIDAFFGAGQSDFLAGFASSSFYLGTSTYTEGFAVINGKDLGLTNTQTSLIVAHEIGHFIGLDHSLVDIDEDLTNNMGVLITACTTKARNLYPLMFPVVCRLTSSLHADDVTSVSTLYPSTTINQQMGQITGKLTQVTGTAVLGANIWAQNTITNNVYSVVSDYIKYGTGVFSLYLPAGTYTLHANSIDPTFNGSSSVGPYADDANGASFKAPNPITDVNFEASTPGSTEMLIVTTGEATDVVFKLDGSGTVKTGSSIFTPGTPLTNSNFSTDGDGGSFSPLFLFTLIIFIVLRLFHIARQR